MKAVAIALCVLISVMGLQAAESVRVQTTGEIVKSEGDDSLRFVADDGQKYIVLKGLEEKTVDHVGKQVKLVAKAKPTKSGKAQMLVHLITIKSAE